MAATPPDPNTAQSGITAVVSGHGADLVLVHGSAGDYRQWAPIATHLQARFRVVALSRRFHFPNPEPPDGASYTYEGHRDDLLEYLRLHTGRVHLAGHSYGAGVALLAALDRPWLVASLTLIEPALQSLLPEGVPDLDVEMDSRNAMMQSVRSLVAAGRPEDAARALIDWTQGGDGEFDRLPPPARDGLLENAGTVGPTCGTPPPRVTCDQLRELAVPALVLRGERTRIYYRLIAERAAACLPQATLRVVPGAGHMSIVEQPSALAAMLAAFVASSGQ